ncbi:hypothetical protein D3C85_1139940 [compost metagenome]
MWLAGLMNFHPKPMNNNTTITFTTTKTLLRLADSFVPRINNNESNETITIAGRLIPPPSTSANDLVR